MKKINRLNGINTETKDKSETRINTELSMNQQRIINIADAVDPSDALNLLQAKNIINQETISPDHSSKFITLTGTSATSPVTGNLIFNNTNTVTGLAPASQLTEAINFSQLKTFFSKYISLSGTAENSPVTGSLILDNTKITGIIPASSDNEAVPLQQLKDTVSTADLVPLSGGSMSGLVNMQSHTITNVGAATASSDLISVSDAHSIIENLFGPYIPLSGTTASDFVTGNIFLDNKLITHIPIATQASEIISLANVKNIVTSLVALNAPNLSGNLNLSGHSVTNVSPATTASEGVNLQQVKTTMQSLLRITGGIMNTDLDMNNNLISALKDATENTELINLETLNKYTESLSSLYIPLSGTVQDFPVSGDLVFDSSHLITGISDPVLPADAVNLQTVNTSVNLKMPLTGGSLSGNVDMNSLSITSLSVPTNPNDNDAASLGYFSSLLQAEKYVPLSGTLPEQPVTGPLFFNNSATCSQIADPVNNSDAVNLQTLTKQASLYLSLSGGSLTGTLNMNNHNILNISNTGNPSSLVNLANLTTAVSKLVSLNSSSPILMTGALNMNSHTITDVPSATSSGDLVSLSQTNLLLSSLRFIPFSGNTVDAPITGNCVLQNTLVRNISSPNNKEDAVTLLLLNDTFKKCLLLTGGVMTGSLNAGNNVISGLAEASSGTDAINLQNLNTSLSGLLPLKGGALSGTLTMSSQKITGVPQPINSSDAVPLQFVTTNIEKLSTFIPLAGNSSAKPITGNIVLANTIVTNISTPSLSSDAVRFDTLKNKLLLYLPLSGNTMTGSIDMENHNIVSLPNPVNATDLVNLVFFNNFITNINTDYVSLTGTVSPLTGNISFSSTGGISGLPLPKNATDIVSLDSLNQTFSVYLPLTSGNLTGELNMNDNFVTVGASPVQPGDGVDFETMTTYISTIGTKAIPLAGTTFTDPVTGDLIFNGTTITDFKDPVDPGDIVSLQNVSDKFSSYLPLSGNTMTGTILMNSYEVINVVTGTLPTSAINYGQVTNAYTKYVQLSVANNITGNILLNNTLIKNIPDPTNPGDAVNLNTLTTTTKPYLPLSGGTLSGPLDMNNHSITNLGAGLASTDAANYGQLSQKNVKEYYIQTSGNTPLNYTLTSNGYLNFSINTSQFFSSQSFQTYFKISGTKLYILQPNIYVLHINIQTNSPTETTSPITLQGLLTTPSIGTSIIMTGCSLIYPETFYLCMLLPLLDSNISSTNTYIEIQNVSSDLYIDFLSWDITSINTLEKS